MVAQRGKDFLLKMDEAGGGTYTTVAGLRSRRLAFNAETVDVTDTATVLDAFGTARDASVSGKVLLRF